MDRQDVRRAVLAMEQSVPIRVDPWLRFFFSFLSIVGAYG
jgi:hypothetical protein